MEYRIIKAADIDNLVVYVNTAISDGWQVTGGVSIVQSVTIWYIQAIYK